MKKLFLLLLIPSVCFGGGATTQQIAAQAASQRPSGSASPTPDVLWWKFTEGSGTSVAATVGPNGTTDGTWVSGPSGSPNYGLSFNGTSTELKSDSALTYGTNIITISWWMLCSNAASVHIVLESGDNFFNGPDRYEIFLNFGTGLNLRSGGTTGQNDKIWTGFSTGSSWVHYLMVFDNSTASGTMKLYVNGSSVSLTAGSSDKTGTSAFSNQILNVASRNSGSFWLEAKFYDFRVYTGDRSADAAAIYADPQ